MWASGRRDSRNRSNFTLPLQETRCLGRPIQPTTTDERPPQPPVEISCLCRRRRRHHRPQNKLRARYRYITWAHLSVILSRIMYKTYRFVWGMGNETERWAQISFCITQSGDLQFSSVQSYYLPSCFNFCAAALNKVICLFICSFMYLGSKIIFYVKYSDSGNKNRSTVIISEKNIALSSNNS